MKYLGLAFGIVTSAAISPVSAQSMASGDCSCQSSYQYYSEFDGQSWDGWQIVDYNSISLTIDVPEISLDSPSDATLTINGDKTASTGKSRRFVVKNLQPGKSYNFTVVAVTTNRAGIELQQTEKITLKTGESRRISMKPIKRKE